MKGLILAAPTSGAGKTTVTLALLRLLVREGFSVRGAKSGPDYIDPRFHAAACGHDSVNLDAWAMTPARLTQLACRQGGEMLVVEGAMGLFDGAPPDGRGAVADLARSLNLPVILIVDAGRMAQSIAPLVIGFANHDPDVCIAGVILNRVGSPRHAAMLRRALAGTGIPVLGCLPRRPDVALPSRHLGLVQAEETKDLQSFLDRAADALKDGIEEDAPFDLSTLLSLASPVQPVAAKTPQPPAQRIALARDSAFTFSYPHMLEDWRQAGAEILPFSPLADAPVPDADLVYLPGGYPELHAGKLAANTRFLQSLRKHSDTRPVFGECGGYMVLGEGLTDADGTRHAMAGLLKLETSFAKPRLHLGYRHLNTIFAPFPENWRGHWSGHEFHYASTLRAEGEPLFEATDAEGSALPPMGLRQGNTCGSFAHLIEPV